MQFDRRMTLQLVLEEYVRDGKTSISYSHFARQYNNWKDKQPSSMRQTYAAGESLFIDYSGDKIKVIDSETGEIKLAEVFVGVLGASNYIYLEATWSQKLPDWIGSHKRMFEHFDGVPRILVIDNLKSGVTNPALYEPDLNPSYAQFISHYNTSVIPARPYKPKDKSKAENGVLIVQRWVLMRLRKMTITGLAELNQILRELMHEVNDRKFKKLPYNRHTAFITIDKPALMPLPAIAYNFKLYKQSRVGPDYHVNLFGHYYSVPYHYVNEVVELWYDSHVIEVYTASGKCIAKHIRSINPGNTTLTQHMTERHKKTVEWTPERCLLWANTVGVSTGHFVGQMLEKVHNIHSRRSCLGLMSLSKRYTPERLELACSYALTIGGATRKDLIVILVNNIEGLLLAESDSANAATIIHDNIRGAQYYI
jgi:transposase